jgi:D-glycero-D-manno-heptose 1,7-bisphosphate phosphatase
MMMQDCAVLFDRDGTLIIDGPPDRDPELVQLMPRAADAVALAREWNFFVGVVTSQPRRMLSAPHTMFRIHARIEELVGSIDGWFVCIHQAMEGCDCRKPRPGLIEAAARRFGVTTSSCVVVGDIGYDVEAAHAAGARAVLVPTPLTRQEEIDAAPVVARDLFEAVNLVIEGLA